MRSVDLRHEGEMENIEAPGKDRDGIRAFCTHCRREQTFIHAPLSNRFHLILTVVTFGLWLPVWAALLFGRSLRPWRCKQCGWHKPEFRGTTRVL